MAAAGRFILRSRRVVAGGRVGPATVWVAGSRIEWVGAWEDGGDGAHVDDVGDDVIMPGVVDTHVHVNEPGRTDWEGFESATRAAAAGGVTTIVDMPLNSIPATTTVEALHAKTAAMRGKCAVDVGLWGGVVPGNAGALRPLWDAGVLGFKCFLVHSGVDEFPNVEEADLREAMPILAGLGAPLLVHAELPGPIEAATQTRVEPTAEDARGAAAGDPRRYSTWLRSRPRAAEDEAIAMMIELAREYGTRVHIVHLSSSDSVAPLRAARGAGLPVTVETCPHYLVFAAEEIPDGATEFKCAPPIRESTNRESLWRALAAGDIDLVATDHSPSPPALKCRESGDFMRAWGGIASLQLGLAATGAAALDRGFTVADVARWMCEAPARLAGLARRKGAIAEGLDADLVVWRPEERHEVARERLYHRHGPTPYHGRSLATAVVRTYVRGRLVHARPRGADDSFTGQWLRRG